MAFGRSNSLSLNTAAPNSLFSQQNAQQPNNPPQSHAGSLFGGAAQNTTQPSGGLFGGGSLFANNNNNNHANQPSQQQSTAGALFGNTTTMASTSNNATTTASNLFSGLGQTNPAATNPNNPPSLFAAPRPSAPIGNLFSNAAAHQQAQSNAAASSVFGLSAVPASQLNNTLLQASQFRASHAPQPFAGRLTMGQPGGGGGGGANPPQAAPPPASVGAVRIHANDLRGTTRFADCVDEVKTEFESVDRMIQKQESFCREIQAILSAHEEKLNCIPPSVQVVQEKAEGVEMVLVADAKAVDEARKVVEGDGKDVARVQRVVENLMLPSQFHQPSSAVSTAAGGAEEGYDTDLVGNYFIPLAGQLQSQLELYSKNLAEIEQHMGVLESSALGQARRLAAKRAGVSGDGGNGDDTVRELAETLRGFEQSILTVAATVGECREGVNGLVLGRVGERIGGGSLGRW